MIPANVALGVMAILARFRIHHSLLGTSSCPFVMVSPPVTLVMSFFELAPALAETTVPTVLYSCPFVWRYQSNISRQGESTSPRYCGKRPPFFIPKKSSSAHGTRFSGGGPRFALIAAARSERRLAR